MRLLFTSPKLVDAVGPASACLHELEEERAELNKGHLKVTFSVNGVFAISSGNGQL
ncbi:hypothetical protein [Spirosoma knui]